MKIIFDNPKALERGLTLFIKEAQLKKDIQELIDSIYDNPEQYNTILKPLFSDKYLREYYDAVTILELLTNIYYHYKIKDSKTFLHYFCKDFNRIYNEWVTIFPLDYNEIFSKPLTSSVKFGRRVKILPQAKNYKLLGNLLSKEYKTPDLKEDMEDYQRRKRKTLINNPLLCIKFHGTRDAWLGESLRVFRYFKWLQDVFVAAENKRNKTFNANQEMTKHFYFLNLKKGALEALPLWEGSKCLFKSSDQLFVSFKKKHLEFFIQLIFDDIEEKLFGRIFNALHFFSKGFNSGDDLGRFIYYVFAMESLFTKRGMPIAASLADNISLLCYPPAKRLEIYRVIKKIYNYRSDIVHSGKHIIDSELLSQTEEISSRAIVSSLEWFRKAKKSCNLEDSFFDYLLTLKLK